MSNTTVSLTRKVSSAGDLQSVVRTLKALAASSIGQYERSTQALGDYYTVERGLGLCFRQDPAANVAPRNHSSDTVAINARSIGRRQAPAGKPFRGAAFRADHRPLDGTHPHGKRSRTRRREPRRRSLPEAARDLFYNSSKSGKALPERIGDKDTILRALLREYLFNSLFRACAESLASENASRLAAMERADKNIEELLDTLHRHLNHIRQSSIDEELFDVISGFQALSKG